MQEDRAVAGKALVLVNCPKCGTEVPVPVKIWPMISRPNKSGEMLLNTVTLYKCGNCGESFRKIIGKEKTSVGEILQKNKSLEEMVMEATKKKAELEQNIKTLQEERAILLEEIEALKSIPELEVQSSILEAEVLRLREETRELEEKATPIEVQKETLAEEPAEAPAEIPVEVPEETPAETPEQAEESVQEEEQPTEPAEEKSNQE